jgi:formylglycine-generating enzyme
MSCCDRGGMAVAEPGPAALEPPSPDMVWIPQKTYEMGSDRHYAEERPVHEVRVDGFWIDRYPVTNERFSRFIEATGYTTFAEIPPDAAQYPGALPEMLYAGSLVFVRPEGPVDRRNIGNWWSYMKGAHWRHPQGPGSSIVDRQHHPVVHVTFGDAEAFAKWEGKSLPTESEWELAARGGLDGAPYGWGDTFLVGGRHMANTWQGEFPWQNLGEDGFEGTSPVDAFPANAYGVHDMIGNVWEWTTDWYRPAHGNAVVKACCAPPLPTRAREEDSYDPEPPHIRIPRKVIKGGSHLCAPNYCRRYRPSARFPEPIDTSTCHLGFRCVVRVGAVAR